MLYDEYLERLSNCQSRLLKRFSHLAQINESGQHNEDSMISGTEHLPDFGGYESWQQNGMSCLVDGNYEIDSYSSFGKIQLKMVQSVLDAGPIRMEIFI